MERPITCHGKQIHFTCQRCMKAPDFVDVQLDYASDEIVIEAHCHDAKTIERVPYETMREASRPRTTRIDVAVFTPGLEQL